MHTLRLPPCLGLLLATTALAQAGQWSPPPPTPPPLPPLPAVPATRPPPAQPAPLESAPTRFRFGPALNLLWVSLAPVPGPQWTAFPLPSLRAGVRFSLLPRSLAAFSMNYSVAVQAGLEGLRTQSGAPFFGPGFTVRAGASPVTSGGMFVPFFDGYALATLGVVTINRVTAVVPRVGLGAGFNPFALRPRSGFDPSPFWFAHSGGAGFLALLLFIAPNLEVVWTPPHTFNPTTHLIELRLGLGF